MSGSSESSLTTVSVDPARSHGRLAAGAFLSVYMVAWRLIRAGVASKIGILVLNSFSPSRWRRLLHAPSPRLPSYRQLCLENCCSRRRASQARRSAPAGFDIIASFAASLDHGLLYSSPPAPKSLPGSRRLGSDKTVPRRVRVLMCGFSVQRLNCLRCRACTPRSVVHCTAIASRDTAQAPLA